MKKYLFSLVLGSLLTLGSVAQATELSAQNQVNDQAVLALLWMQRSAEFQACSYQAYNALRNTIEVEKDSYSAKPKAIILDIDETILDNTPFKARTVGTEIGKARGAFSKWVAKEKAEVLPGAAKALQLAKKNGISLFYVSDRSAKSDLQATINNLCKHNIPDADEKHLLLFKGDSNKQVRFEEVEKGYKVIAYVGDNLLDFPLFANKANETERAIIVAKNSKKFGSKFIMLPNPDYGSWEYALAEGYRKFAPEQMLATRKAALKVDNLE